MKSLILACAVLLCTDLFAITKTWQLTDTMTASLDDKGNLRIDGTGDMPDFMYGDGWGGFDSAAPWFLQGNLDQLHSVVVAPGVTSVGALAFSKQSCAADSDIRTHVDLPSSIRKVGAYGLVGCRNDDPSGLFIFGGVLYSYYGSDSCVTIPDGVTRIAEEAFCSSDGLVSVTIPSSVTSIGEDAFSECGALTSITIPPSLTSIGEDAFYGCSALADEDGFVIVGGVLYGYVGKAASVIIPSGVTRIGSEAFSGSDTLVSVSIPLSVTSIGRDAFSNCFGLKSVTIPSGVTSIGEGAFCNCCALTSVTIPSSVTSIGSYAFGSCRALTSVTIPSSVTSIGSYAFESCSALSSVTISSSEMSVGDGAFNGCNALADENGFVIVGGVLCSYIGTATSVIIPSTVKSIGRKAFCGCTALTSVTVPPSVTSIGEDAFYGCSALADEDGFVIVGGVLYEYVGKAASVKIPSGVTKIGAYAFGRHCKCDEPSPVASVIIPSTVKSIGEGAFCNCRALTSIMIPPSVTSIGREAFGGCSTLTSVTIPPSVTSIGRDAFFGCSTLTSVTIPPGVTNIGSYAFYLCRALTSVAIPSSVMSIGELAFDACDSLRQVRTELGDAARVRALTRKSGFYNTIDWIEGAEFKGDAKSTLNGVVCDASGGMVGIVQLTTAKKTAKGDVKVSGFVMLDDGKKQTLKAVSAKIEDGMLRLATTVGKLGTVNLVIYGDGFTGSLGGMSLASDDLDEETGIFKGTITLNYFDRKTGKLKTKKIALGGATDSKSAIGTLTAKGSPVKAFEAAVE